MNTASLSSASLEDITKQQIEGVIIPVQIFGGCTVGIGAVRINEQ